MSTPLPSLTAWGVCSLKFSYFVNGTFDRASAYVTEAAFDVLRKEQGWSRH